MLYTPVVVRSTSMMIVELAARTKWLAYIQYTCIQVQGLKMELVRILKFILLVRRRSQILYQVPGTVLHVLGVNVHWTQLAYMYYHTWYWSTGVFFIYYGGRL
jgi:hypothetical protein